MLSTAGVTSDQLHAMWRVCSEIINEPDARRACRRLAERVSEIIGAPAVVYRREVSPWQLVAGAAPHGAEAPAPPAADALADPFLALADAAYPAITGRDDTPWTPVPLDEGLPYQSILLISGDWRTGPAADWLPRFARTASMSLRLVTASHSARRGEQLAGSAYAFARRLGQISGERPLHQFIIDAAAQAVNARLATLSVYRPSEGIIAVTATHGYPTEAVGDVRIAPGSGIIGGVFASRKPLLVRDTTRVPGLTPPSTRYRTSSFMALPIVAGHDALGVVTLADRADNRPFTRDDLGVARVITALSALALVREQLARLRDELAHMAAIDPVTTLFNRRYLETRLEAEIERSRRTGAPVALLMVDVDGFKPINDQCGHPTGDAVLRKLADIVRRSVRTSDVCTRYGGDELAVIVPENAASAAQTAERVRGRVDLFDWESVGVPPPLRVTVSIGVGISEAGEAARALVHRADQHLYEAKARGRNRVHPPGS